MMTSSSTPPKLSQILYTNGLSFDMEFLKLEQLMFS